MHFLLFHYILFDIAPIKDCICETPSNRLETQGCTPWDYLQTQPWAVLDICTIFVVASCGRSTMSKGLVLKQTLPSRLKQGVVFASCSVARQVLVYTHCTFVYTRCILAASWVSGLHPYPPSNFLTDIWWKILLSPSYIECAAAFWFVICIVFAYMQ